MLLNNMYSFKKYRIDLNLLKFFFSNCTQFQWLNDTESELMMKYEKVCLKTRQKYMCSYYIIPISQGQFAVNFRGNSCGMECGNCWTAAFLCKFLPDNMIASRVLFEGYWSFAETKGKFNGNFNGVRSFYSIL